MGTKSTAPRSEAAPKSRVNLGPVGKQMAEFLERYPDAEGLRIISGNDGNHGALSHHYGGLRYQGSPTAALDIVFEGPGGAEKMRDLAKWLYDNYADFTVELIHTYERGKKGAYVKNQKTYPDGSVYGGPAAIGHEHHIHWATSAALLERAKLPRSRDTGPIPMPAGVIPGPGEPADAVGIANTAPVWGWDASNNDWDPKRGPMDLVSAQRDGISFFTHKATEGSDFKDPYFKQALERARAAGIPVLGCYHYLWPDNIEAQVNFWMDYVESQTPWWKEVPWIWQIDAEKDGVPRPPTPEEIARAVAVLKRRMEIQGTRGYVVVYAPHWLYENSLGAGYDIWNSYYVGSGSPRAFKEQYQGVGDKSAGWDLMSGRVPRILQFSSDGVVGRQNTCDINKFNGDLHALIRLCGRDPGRIGAPVTQLVAAQRGGPDKVLSYDHSDSFLRQEQYWDCGPAATQIVLKALGIDASERTLIAEIGTTENGTDCVQLIERVLDKRLPGANFTSIEMNNDPPTAADKETLWNNIVRSIDAGYGIVMNWVVPPGNYPVGVKGSVSPSYSNGTYWHYVACMGYDSTPGKRAVWMADGGFNPHEYWISFDQAATLIPPKAYCFALAGARAPVGGQTVAQLPTQPPSRSMANVVPHDLVGWRHTFSDGLTRDADEVLTAVMEFVIEWRKAHAVSTATGAGVAEEHSSVASQSRGVDLAPRAAVAVRGPIDPGPPVEFARKIGNVTGIGITDRWGIGATDLGVMTLTPSGRILAVFGDTFRGERVGSADWRAPVGLISDTRNLDDGIVWTQAAGRDPGYARQFWDYSHLTPAGVKTTVLPSDVITIGDAIYLHTTAHFPFGNPGFGEIWKSTDEGRTWSLRVPNMDINAHGGLAQLWTWALGDDDFVYILSTAFNVDRDREVILRRVHKCRIEDPSAYEGWGWGTDNGSSSPGWAWGREPSPLTGKGYGEMSLRRIDGQWVFVAFNKGSRRLDVRVFSRFEDYSFRQEPTVIPIWGCDWGSECDGCPGKACSVAQLYGPSIVPGSRPGSGFHILLSQWHNPPEDGLPYHAMQFKIPVPSLRRSRSRAAAPEFAPCESETDPKKPRKKSGKKSGKNSGKNSGKKSGKKVRPDSAAG